MGPGDRGVMQILGGAFSNVIQRFEGNSKEGVYLFNGGPKTVWRESRELGQQMTVKRQKGIGSCGGCKGSAT
jgi:hypothetical protein